MSRSEAQQVLLAKKWDESVDPKGWWMSEKLDGVRAYWDGSRFYSRNGNVFYAPDFFKKGLPKTPLDGELWGGRGMFQKTVSIAKTHSGDDNNWKCVTYAVFDVPKLKNDNKKPAKFEQRMEWLHQNIIPSKTPYAAAVVSIKCRGKQHLNDELKTTEAKGGEGLMLRRPHSVYEHGRRDSLLKVKSFKDEEGIVVGHEKGKGNNMFVCGAILLETPDGRKIKVGTGLTDADRRNPPKKGSIVSYKYFEVNASGTPRFPVFIGKRIDMDWKEYCKTYEPPKKTAVKELTRQHSIMFGPKIGKKDSNLSSEIESEKDEIDPTKKCGSKRTADEANIDDSSTSRKKRVEKKKAKPSEPSRTCSGELCVSENMITTETSTDIRCC
eukprot:m.42194 g.42194  ORF g.42194 m.42194 type:complete len:382 (-) comp9856_c0_seq1:65-1210(-)